MAAVGNLEGMSVVVSDKYRDHIAEIERGLGDFAFKSSDLTYLVDGTEALKYYEDQWVNAQARLSGRTPIMLERDRILYSDELRRQADKHHVLFQRNHSISRDYTSHTLRVAHVARSTARRLELNFDLAEAIALGCKVGAVPFLHVAKGTVDEWARARFKSLDDASKPQRSGPTQQAFVVPTGVEGQPALPSWLAQLHDDDLRRGILDSTPLAMGSVDEPAYTSGSQSYWVLSTKPFLPVLDGTPYTRQTMYGIWRHSLSGPTDARVFRHSMPVYQSSGARVTMSLSEADLTHEAVLVRYADDITWVIENLSEANRAAAMAGGRNAVYGALAEQVAGEDPPSALQLALQPVANPGRVYTYFIDDLVRTSATAMRGTNPAQRTEIEPLITFSPLAARMLRLLEQFLKARVFDENRVRLRNGTLGVITRTVLDLLYDSYGEALIALLDRRSKIDTWREAERKRAVELVEDPVWRVRACIDALSMMSDRDVYDVIGLDAS
jgi:dGTP triphosphohydrolase